MLGGRLREARERRFPTQKAVAKRLRWDPSHLSRIERGDRTPDPFDLHALMKLYGITLEWLVRPADVKEVERHQEAKASRSRRRGE